MSTQLSNRIMAIVKPTLGFALLILIWQFGAPLAKIPSYVLPLPTSIAARFAETFSVQMHGLMMTAFTTLAGLALALVFGVLLALLVIYIPLLRSLIMPLLAAFNSIPKIAIAPLFVIWFGLGYEFENPARLPARPLSDLREFRDRPRRNRGRHDRPVDARRRYALAHLPEGPADECRAVHHGRAEGRVSAGAGRLHRRRVHRRQRRHRPSDPVRAVQHRYVAGLRGAAVDHRVHDRSASAPSRLFENAVLKWRPSQRKR